MGKQGNPQHTLNCFYPYMDVQGLRALPSQTAGLSYFLRTFALCVLQNLPSQKASRVQVTIITIISRYQVPSPSILTRTSGDGHNCYPNFTNRKLRVRRQVTYGSHTGGHKGQALHPSMPDPKQLLLFPASLPPPTSKLKRFSFSIRKAVKLPSSSELLRGTK